MKTNSERTRGGPSSFSHCWRRRNFRKTEALTKKKKSRWCLSCDLNLELYRSRWRPCTFSFNTCSYLWKKLQKPIAVKSPWEIPSSNLTTSNRLADQDRPVEVEPKLFKDFSQQRVSAAVFFVLIQHAQAYLLFILIFLLLLLFCRQVIQACGYDIPYRLVTLILLPMFILGSYIKQLKNLVIFSSLANVLQVTSVILIISYIARNLRWDEVRQAPDDFMNLAIFFGLGVFSVEGIGVVSWNLCLSCNGLSCSASSR